MLSGYYTNYQASVIYAHHRAFGSPGGKLRREGVIAGTNVFFFEQLLESQVVHELAPNFSTNNRRCRGNKKQVWFQSSYTSLSVTLLPEVNGVALEKRTKFLIGVLRRWAGLRGRFLYTQQMINFWKTKRILTAARGKWLITHKGSLIRLSTDLSSPVLQARRQWANMFKAVKETKLSTEDPISRKTVLPKRGRNEDIPR